MTLKRHVKRAVFASGALNLYRRAALSDTLTVAMFHRVMPASDPRFNAADRAYTMRLDVFEGCLQFFGDHYHVVGLDDVEAAAAGDRALPRHALLITFDDGWEDNARYALPALAQRGMKAVVFVATDAMTSDLTLWTDVAACVSRALKNAGTPSEHASVETLQAWLKALPPSARNGWLEAAVAAQGERVRPLMMGPDTVRTLIDSGVTVAAHGASHTPLTEVADLAGELARAKRDLETWTGKPARALAYPHGRHSADIVATVSSAGFALQFTSEPHLNRLAAGRPLSPVFGRLDIPEAEIVDKESRFDPERLAYWLTMRPVR
ncbi:MAG: polysaccharide deacetylase family protein [Alphaproteobacteria bacterium]|nr:polysaccharide deacetylase family protein [Alphaproteobacteria bacterium]